MPMIEQKYRHLWWEVTLTKICFSVVPLFVLAFTVYNHFSEAYTAKIMDNLRTLAENRRASLDLFFEERVNQLVTLAYTESLSELSNEDYLNKVFNVMQSRSRSYLDLGVIDEEGNHLAYVGPHHSILRGVNYKNEPWFHAVMSTGVFISDIFMGFRRVPHFIIAVMVREKNRQWILRATIDSDVIENIVRAAWIGKTGDAYIIDQNNILQTKPRFGGNLLEPLEGPCDYANISSLRVDEVTWGGDKVLCAGIPIRTKKWVLVLTEDPREPLAPLLQAKNMVALLSLGGVLLISIGAVFTTRKLVNQLIRTDREKAASDEVAMQSSKMAALGKMAAGIAHEINNPLAVIGEKAGWIKDLLMEEDVRHSANLQEIEESVTKIEYHVDRAKKVTHRLLGFARRMEPVEEKVMINQVLTESVSFLENEARFMNIDIQKDLDPEIPTIMSDQTQLQQVFLNLINNAIDAIGKDGRIILKTAYQPRSNRVMIAISDNGPGIPKDILGKIFDPFFTTKEVGKGTGLGLSISYGIIEKLGGTMKVESEVGHGTTFTIFLPVSDSEGGRWASWPH